MREDWLTIVGAIRGRGMECTMVTGGRSFTSARAHAAKDAGILSVSVSIDGTEATHDALRGARGSYARAIGAMGYLAAAGVQVSANSQIGRTNRRELPLVFDAITAAGAHSWQIQLTVAAGRAADDASLLLEPYQMLEVMPAVGRVKAQAAARDIRIWPGNNLGYYGPFEAALRGNLPGGRRGSCGAGRAVIGIESNGGIKACPSLPSDVYVGGNVRDDDLRDIWERSAPLRFTRDDRREELWGRCAECYYADECLGGCSWTAHSLFGRRGNNPFCHHRALDLLRRGRRERLIQTAPAGGASFDHGTFEIVEEEWPAGAIERARAVAAGVERFLSD